MGLFSFAARSLCNQLGVAWWAKVETVDPNVIYWFGPFLTKSNLELNLRFFLEDLSQEGFASITKKFVRCRRSEPLTI